MITQKVDFIIKVLKESKKYSGNKNTSKNKVKLANAYFKELLELAKTINIYTYINVSKDDIIEIAKIKCLLTAPPRYVSVASLFRYYCSDIRKSIRNGSTLYLDEILWQKSYAPA
jgi:hypothetical protein